MDASVFSMRLKNARLMRGLSMGDLSGATHGEVSKSAIAKYEKGLMRPSGRVLILLSSVLEVKIDDLLRPQTVEVDMESIRYRKKSTLSKTEQNSILFRVSDKVEKYLELENTCGIRNTSILKYDNIIETNGDAQSMAIRFRKEYNLGLAPIVSPIDFLENEGVKIIEIEASSKFDGNSFVVDDVVVIVLNKNFSEERKRLSLFHELGHRILSFKADVTKDEEEHLCNAFANEVLLPSQVFKDVIGEVRKSISLVELASLRDMYGISVDAMMYKAKSMGIITENQYKTFRIIKHSDASYKEEVEKSTFAEEHSTRFKRIAYMALAKALISESKCANLLNISVGEVRANAKLV